MKKIIYLAVLMTGLVVTAAATPDVSEKIIKAFNETFSTAQNVTWQEFDNKNCQANFKLDEVIVKALYDKEGELLETIRYYSEKTLPQNITAKLKKKYSGKEIFGITEIAGENDISYYITLKDDKNWYTVKSDPYGNLGQINKFKIASAN